MAAERKDFLTDVPTGNYLVEDGDLVIGASLHQEAVAIVSATRGNYSHHPLVGCDSKTWQNAAMTKQAAQRIIKRQWEADGINPEDVTITINAEE